MIARVLVAVTLLVAGCSELPPIADGQCGNGIIDPGEDCDEPSGTCSQCRIVCTEAVDPQALGDCPSGYTCGIDNFCSGPGAAFSPAVASVPFPVLGYRVVDVDHDHFGDVIGINQTALVTRYGSPRADLSASSIVVTPPLQGIPVLTHLDGPGVDDDLVIPVNDGLVAYTGAFGLPSPRQFPFNTVDARPGGRPSPRDVIQIDKTIGMLGARSTDDSTLTFGVLQVAGLGAGYDAETSDFCGGTYSIDDLVIYTVIAYHAANTTYVALQAVAGTLCILTVTPQPQARGAGSCPDDPTAFMQSPTCAYTITSLSSMPAFATKPVFADLDGDGCPSLIDGDGGANGLVEHRGTMAGAMCSIASTGTALPSFGQPADSKLVGMLPLQPAAAGLRPEALITTYGITGLTTATSPQPQPLYISDRPVQFSEPGDLNSDGHLDVVLTTVATPNLDIVRRVPGSDQFLLTRQSTTGSVVYTIVGDFDGDTRSDLAYVERLGEQDQLSISYGVPGGVLPGLPVDAFKHLIFLAVMEVPDSADPFSIVDDLVAVDLPVGTDDPEITILHGSSNRTMLSFYGGVTPDPDSVFRGVAAGNFVATGDSASFNDLFAFQTHASGPTTLHVIPGLPEGRLGPAEYAQGFVLPTSPLVGSCSATPVPAFCLELASFVAVPVSADHDVLFGVDIRPDAPSVLRVDTAADGIHTSVRNDVLFGTGHIHDLDQLDIDRDGRPELIAAFSPSAGARDGHIGICKLTADDEIATCVDVAIDVLGDPRYECVAFARGRVTPPCEVAPDGAADLAVLCRAPGTSVVFQIAGDASGYVARRTLMSVPNKTLGDIGLGDVTGDGLDDLVMISTDSQIPQLEVYPQLSSRQSNACVSEPHN